MKTAILALLRGAVAVRHATRAAHRARVGPAARAARIGVLVGVLVGTLAGCGTLHLPEAPRPAPVRPVSPSAASVAPAYGSIYRQASYQPLFEDRRARFVGDTLTININEKVAASKTASSNTSRKGGMDFSLPAAQIGSIGLKGAALSAESANTFAGKGDSAANNVFTGAITVTVVEVLSNGNLLVAGEKQIGINQGSEFIRLSGLVNPLSILTGNVVSSTQVADARIEYRGTGYLDETQTMGWLSRAFLSVMPF